MRRCARASSSSWDGSSSTCRCDASRCARGCATSRGSAKRCCAMSKRSRWPPRDAAIVYSIRNYGEMILDAARMDAYVRALRQAVKPGCVVLDIGTGTGIFALLACRFGARRVFAVEPSDAICVAQEIAAANGCAATIEFFQALSTDITLPERADVIVSDLRGILPFFGRHLAAIADARERHLVPGGAMIPAADTLWLAVVESPELYRRPDAPWSAHAYGLDMGAARALAANSSSRATIRPGELAADPVACGTIDYREIRDPDFSCEVRLR